MVVIILLYYFVILSVDGINDPPKVYMDITLSRYKLDVFTKFNVSGNLEPTIQICGSLCRNLASPYFLISDNCYCINDIAFLKQPIQYGLDNLNMTIYETRASPIKYLKYGCKISTCLKLLN